MSKDRVKKEFYREIIYSDEQWKIFEEKRIQAIKLLEIFERQSFNPYVYGSVARGDVDESSDIDIIIPHKIPSFKIEFILNNNNINNYTKEIIMATPNDSIKYYIHLSELECITIPLTKLDRTSLEFYSFGGKVNYNQLKNMVRVPGIDKNLKLVIPTKKGHKELSIIDQESIAAKKVGVSIQTINERKRVLLRRKRYGKTGVFLKRELSLDETPEDILEKIARKNSIIRKKYIER
ncbi:MAG: nucleotidyltransferase domain-containing protein [Candidatus Lokiarchaeota archaeon]|nr:nucleotidyltransferase domain-containing protein [Candidatus Lokiarchaeota archaeon]